MYITNYKKLFWQHNIPVWKTTHTHMHTRVNAHTHTYTHAHSMSALVGILLPGQK